MSSPSRLRRASACVWYCPSASFRGVASPPASAPPSSAAPLLTVAFALPEFGTRPESRLSPRASHAPVPWSPASALAVGVGSGRRVRPRCLVACQRVEGRRAGAGSGPKPACARSVAICCTTSIIYRVPGRASVVVDLRRPSRGAEWYACLGRHLLVTVITVTPVVAVVAVVTLVAVVQRITGIEPRQHAGDLLARHDIHRRWDRREMLVEPARTLPFLLGLLGAGDGTTPRTAHNVLEELILALRQCRRAGTQTVASIRER